MRSRLVLIVTVLATIAVVLLPSGSQAGEPLGRFVTITKTVVGDGPTGGYQVEFTCTSEGGAEGGNAIFDTAGPGSPQTIAVSIPNDTTTCTFEETVTNGAEDVSYACTPETPDHACLDDQTVVQTFAGGKYSNTFLDITNTFPAAVDPDEETPPPAVDPDTGTPPAPGAVIAATPGFTG